jgi:hypothetical protein
MSELERYRALCATKRATPVLAGIRRTPELSDGLFDHQRHGVEFALRAGRSALFYDTGLGKTRMMLEWGRHIVEYTNKPVLMLAPLAVGFQHLAEAEAMGVDATLSRFGATPSHPRIAITNYERLKDIAPSDWGGVILDESSILKSFTGATSRKLREAFKGTPFRLCGSATPAPNDHTELGQHSEFLGVLNRTMMLTRFFLHDSADTGEWRLKGHAVRPFWDWVASWARCVSKPSDLGFSDDGFALPPLDIVRRVVEADRTLDSGAERDGQMRLFRIPESSATAIHKEKRLTNERRAAEYARVVADHPGEPVCLWCDTDYEAEAIRAAVPEAVEVSGKMSADEKEERLNGFSRSQVRVLLTKASIAGYGLNWQHCRVTAFPANHSYEQFYQLIRRFWRFGQKRAVIGYEITSDTEAEIIVNRSRKGGDHERMKTEMAAAMRRAAVEHATLHTYEPRQEATLPAWIGR